MQIETLFDQTAHESSRCLTHKLRSLYDGDLVLPDPPMDRPLIFGNFVQTLDGIVSLKIPGKSGGGEISGRNDEDTFIMGLLRSYADAVVIGEETFRTGAGHVWTADFIYPKLNNEFLAFRAHLGKVSPHPLNVVVSGLGTVDLDEPLFKRNDIHGLVLTTGQGEQRLKQTYGQRLPATVHVLPGEAFIDPSDIIRFLHTAYRVKLLLHEGGPTLFAAFLKNPLLDELFLTIAPQIVGRGLAGERPNFSGPLALAPENALWATLLSVKRATAAGHLFLRYRVAANSGAGYSSV